MVREVNWAYPTLDIEASNKRFINLCRLYVLAERLMDDATTSWIELTLYKLGKTSVKDKSVFVPPVDAIKIIYDGTPEGNGARWVLVKLFIRLKDHKAAADVLSSSTNVPHEFFKDLLVYFLLQFPVGGAVSIKLGLHGEKPQRLTERLEEGDYESVGSNDNNGYNGGSGKRKREGHPFSAEAPVRKIRCVDGGGAGRRTNRNPNDDPDDDEKDLDD